MLQNHKKIKKSRLVKTLLDYNVMLYYRVANYNCNRWETLPSPHLARASLTLHIRLPPNIS